MTEKAYERATEIIKEKDILEQKLLELSDKQSDEYIDICNRLFKLGQEFSRL